MKRIYLFLSIIIFTCTTAIAQVTVSGSTGADGTYATLTNFFGAFEGINNAGTQAGNNILITISADIAETGVTSLLEGDWTTLTINPTGGVPRVITTGSVMSLIHLDGADNVTIDGLNSAGNMLTIINLSTVPNAHAILIDNDATYNTITRCNLQGSNALAVSGGLGIIAFGLGIVTGNNNNSITQCNISASVSGPARTGIGSSGIITSYNRNNTISGNNISGIFDAGNFFAAINIGFYNSNWTITNNRIYEPVTRTSSGILGYGISIQNGEGYTITGNVIGFANAAGTGTTNIIGLASGSLGGTFPSSFTPGGTASNIQYTGISCSFTAGGAVSSIQNNTIGGIALYTSSAATATNGMLCGIAVTSGNADIGTVTGNTIGSASGTSSIYVASTSAGGVIAGIYCTSTNTVNIQNNTIGGIDASGTTLSRSTGFKGIDVAGTGTFTVSNNNVGNATANNIRTGYLLTGANLSNTATTPTEAFGGGAVRGIVSSVTGATLDISNNIIQGMQVSGNSSTFAGILTTGTVTTTMNINANQVGNTGTNAVTFPFATSAGVFGVSVLASATGTINLNNNSIYGITCPGANAVTGIFTSTGTPSTILNINSNAFISNVINGPAVSTPMIAISNSAIVSTLNITGNIIRSNSSTATSGGFNGIQNTAAVINGVNITNNQLGNASGGAFTFIAATPGTLTGISNTNAANTAAVNINYNSLDGFSVVSTGQIIFIQNTAANVANANINNNQLGTNTGSLVSFAGSQTATLYGILNNGVANASISNNDFTGITNLIGSTGIQQYINGNNAVGNLTINNNTFTSLSINTVNGVILIGRSGNMSSGSVYEVNNNSIAGSFTNAGISAATMYFGFSSSQSVNGSVVNVTNNNFSNVTVSGGTPVFGWYDLEGVSISNGPQKTYTGNILNNINSATGTFIGIYLSNSAQVTCSNNIITNITTAGNIGGIFHATINGQGTHTISNNTISNYNSTNGNTVGIIAGATTVPQLNINNNNIHSFTCGGSSGQAVGIDIQQGQSVSVYDNNIYNIQGTGGANPFVFGVRLTSGTLMNVFRNRIYDLRQTGSTSGTTTPGLIGVAVIGPSTVNVYNNFVCDLKAPNSAQTDGIRGISVGAITANSNYNLYYNSIYINASSTGINFGTSGIYHMSNVTATTGRLAMIDNIIVNTSIANGTGFTVAYRRFNSNLTNYAAASDYNLFYAGTPSATRLIFYDGTNSDQTLAAYQTRVSARDVNSISIMPVFVSSTDLHLSNLNNCALDGTGTPIPGYTTDIDNQVRDAAAPDIGADEFTAAHSTILAGIAATAVCENKTVSLLGSYYATNTCNIIAYVLPSGVSAVAGKINTCVTRDASQQYFNGEPYVQRHFDIEPVTNPATSTANISLYYTDAEFVAYNSNNPVYPKLPTVAGGANADPFITNVRVTQFHGTPTGGLPTTTPGNYTGTRVLITPALAGIFWNGFFWRVSFDITGFSGFYLHTTLHNTPLPIVVNYLNGYRQGSNHLLNWKVTCTTSPRASMTLERSADGRNYTGINSITADAARCNQPFDYTDTDPLKGMNYYRLKIVDADGKISYSSIVALLNAVKGFDIVSIAPNPVVNDNFKLNVTSAQSGKMEITIFDMQGRLVNRQSISLIAGFNSMPVNMSNLAGGTYTIKGRMADDQDKVIRFVKQ